MSIDMGQTRQRILNEVALKHGVTMDEILGLSRSADKVSARIEIAERLRSSGFKVAQISRILKRDHGTIQYYINGSTKPNRHDRRALPRAIQRLSAEIQEVVIQTAELTNTTPSIIIAEWIAERAQYELEAKARIECGDTPRERGRRIRFANMEAA